MGPTTQPIAGARRADGGEADRSRSLTGSAVGPISGVAGDEQAFDGIAKSGWVQARQPQSFRDWRAHFRD